MKKEELSEGVTLYCGDCREILPMLGKVDAVVTDPPYGINYQHSGRPRNGYMDATAPIFGDEKPFDPTEWLRFSAVILWGANYYADKLPTTNGWLIWDKRCGSPSDDGSDCEMAWTNIDTQARLFHHIWRGGAKAGEEAGQARIHPTQKPIALMRWCIEQIPPHALKILDPFMGSGTTGVAAVKLGRKFIGIEIEPKYFDIACRRIGEALKQPDMFIERPKPPQQQPLGI